MKTIFIALSAVVLMTGCSDALLGGLFSSNSIFHPLNIDSPIHPLNVDSPLHPLYLLQHGPVAKSLTKTLFSPRMALSKPAFAPVYKSAPASPIPKSAAVTPTPGPTVSKSVLAQQAAPQAEVPQAAAPTAQAAVPQPAIPQTTAVEPEPAAPDSAPDSGDELND